MSRLFVLLSALLAAQCCWGRSGGGATAVCINNCGQCKRTYGAFFEGQRCAEACIKYKGLLMPDCNDIATISAFLNKLE